MGLDRNDEGTETMRERAESLEGLHLVYMKRNLRERLSMWLRYKSPQYMLQIEKKSPDLLAIVVEDNG